MDSTEFVRVKSPNLDICKLIRRTLHVFRNLYSHKDIQRWVYNGGVHAVLQIEGGSQVGSRRACFDAWEGKWVGLNLQQFAAALRTFETMKHCRDVCPHRTE